MCKRLKTKKYKKLTKESEKSDEKHVKNMVEKRSMLTQHNVRSCGHQLVSFLHNKFFTSTRATLFEIDKSNIARINVHRHNKGMVPAYNKSLNPTRANKAARAG